MRKRETLQYSWIDNNIKVKGIIGSVEIIMPKNSGLTEYSSSDPSSIDYSSVDPDFLLPDGTPDYLRLILTSRVYDVCKETPITPATGLSTKLGSNILLKREDLQPVFSFKLRGAYNMMAQLSADESWKGVIACSAGNHAQGVAYSAQHLNIPATIVMPTPTPSIKYKNVDRLGAKVVLYGDDFDEAKAECARLAKLHGLTNIPPFDNPYVIAGQGTIGLELIRQVNIQQLKAVFCCVGGGGLIAGVGAYIKRIAPHVKIIGVETYDADAMYRSLKEGRRIVLDEVGLFADGAAVKVTGEETFRLCQMYIDEIVRCTTDEICAAIKDVFQETRSIVEPAGALSVAGVQKYISMHPDHDHTATSYVAVLSGANMNFDRLRFVAERAQLGEGSEVFMIVNIPEKPGSFRDLISLLQLRLVTEFSYRFSDEALEDSSEGNKASVYMSFSVKDRQEVAHILAGIKDKGYLGHDISDNEFAKTHARYLVGGKAKVADERIFGFEFPERPGALVKFLEGIKSKWNITLFHYRNNGSDVGKVVAGLSVPPEDNELFDQFLEQLEYPFMEETDNLAYQLFLKG
jgi:threonine dehydratase